MYIRAMLPTRHEILSAFRAPELANHPRFEGVSTFAFLRSGWPASPITVSLPRVTIVIRAVDYLRREAGDHSPTPLRFQQDCYRLWYQFDGQGVLQQLRQNAFGRAVPGLLGVMDAGQRFSYLHQRGTFECLTIDFQLQPSAQSHCYWNSEIEGKRILSEPERLEFDNSAFTVLRDICNSEDPWGVNSAARITAMLGMLFTKGLLLVRDELFPANKVRSLVAMARRFMDTDFSRLRHQNALSDHCGVDINYLNILFRREAGMTLYRYLTTVRMEHAKHLLEEGEIPVVDIASRVGYPNSNSFSRAFRRHVGQSPSDYAQKHAAPARAMRESPGVGTVRSVS